MKGNKKFKHKNCKYKFYFALRLNGNFTLNEICLLFPLLCLKMFKQIPIPAMKTMTEVPPLDINGRGRPVGGIEPVTTATLSNV